MLCWHNWSKWVEVPETLFADKSKEPEKEAATWLYVTQQRECQKCGKIDLRAVVA
jgi:hypothetical protein